MTARFGLPLSLARGRLSSIIAIDYARIGTNETMGKTRTGNVFKETYLRMVANVNTLHNTCTG